jgi:hypothetical protein
MDRILFGDVPGAVVRDSKKAVAIVREPRGRMTGVPEKSPGICSIRCPT